MTFELEGESVVHCRRRFRGIWLPIDREEPHEIRGLGSWWNRRLSDRLWAELDRVGASRRSGANAPVAIAGEAALGLVLGWQPEFLIGSPTVGPFRRFIVLSGTGHHAGKRWSGRPRHALRLLRSVPSAAGPNAVWWTLSCDEGFAREPGVRAITGVLYRF